MSVIIVNMLKYYQHKFSASILIVFMANYFTAALLSYLLYPFSFKTLYAFDYISGIIIGILFLTNFLVLQKNIRENGMSLSIAIMRVSLIIPIVVSHLIFKELIFMHNKIGIILILVTFLFLGKMKNRSGFLFLIMLFFLTGISDFGMKIYEFYGKNTINTYLFFLFSSALILNIIIIIVRKIKFNKNAFYFGLLLGVPNLLTSYFFMKSLRDVPAIIAYPMLGAGITFITILTDKFIWHSKISRTQIIFLITLIIGIVLIHLK